MLRINSRVSNPTPRKNRILSFIDLSQLDFGQPYKKIGREFGPWTTQFASTKAIQRTTKIPLLET